jgi:hypothetical protein
MKRTPSQMWRGALLPALLIAVGSRIGLALVSWLSLRIFPRFAFYPAQLPDNFLMNHPLLDGWARWDAAHYIAVAQFGYGGSGNPSPGGGAGFFPLYPLLMRGAVGLFGVDPTPSALAVAAIAISNVCFMISIALFIWLGRDQIGDAAARQAALLLCVTPFGFFFNAAYSESLFLMLSLLCLVLARDQRYWMAGLVAGLASGSRLVGLALLPAILFMAYRRGTFRRDFVGMTMLAPSGLVAFFIYSWRKFDDPFAYFHTQSEWGGWSEHVRHYAELFLKHPRQTLTGDPRDLIILFNVVLAAIFLAFLPMVWRKLDPGTALFTTLLVVVQGIMTWVSLGRYLLPAVGVYFVAGVLLAKPRWNGWPRDLVLITSTLALALLTVLYAHGFWVV